MNVDLHLVKSNIFDHFKFYPAGYLQPNIGSAVVKAKTFVFALFWVAES